MSNFKQFNASPLFGFDRKEPQYYKNLRMKTDTGLHEQLSNFIESEIEVTGKRNKKLCVLDWGCGEGAFSQRLHDIGCNVIAVDIDAKEFKAKGPEFHQIDFNSPIEIEGFVKKFTKQFDLIVSIEVIEHIQNPWQFLETIYQLCRQDTRILITTPNISSWLGRFWFLITGELWGFSQGNWVEIGHINPIGHIEMTNLLNEVGFEDIEVHPGGNLPVIWLYNWKSILVSLFMLPLHLVMRGQKKGWALCYLATPRKHQ